MPEEEIETQDLKERLEEAHEHAAHGGSPWLTWLSLSTAIIAVAAAISALESGSYANDAIVQKDDAILHQSKADDAWSYYQAKGVEATVYAAQADSAPNPELAGKFRAEADHEKQARSDIKREAEEEQKAVGELNEKSEHSLHVHHEFAKRDHLPGGDRPFRDRGARAAKADVVGKSRGRGCRGRLLGSWLFGAGLTDADRRSRKAARFRGRGAVEGRPCELSPSPLLSWPAQPPLRLPPVKTPTRATTSETRTWAIRMLRRPLRRSR